MSDTQQALPIAAHYTWPATLDLRTCTTCLTPKPSHAYSRRTTRKDPRQETCKRCARLMAQVNRTGARDRLVAHFYETQNGICPICSYPIRLKDSKHVIDHPHSPDAMTDLASLIASYTGLLHDSCNRAIGMLKDDPAVLRRAARYVEQTRAYGQQRLKLDL